MKLNSKIIIITFCISVIAVLLSFPLVKGDSSNISIIEPANDESVFSSNFNVNVFINDTNIKSAQVRLVGYSWIALEQITATVWGTTMNISAYPDGPGELSAKYLRIGEITPYYVPTTTKISIKNPTHIIITGSIQVTVKDFRGNPVQDVLVNPTGNKTDSNGIVTIGNQPLNTEINFTFSKPDYNTSNLVRIFTNSNLLYHTLTLNTLSGNVRRLKVSGYNIFADVDSMFNLKVTDEATGETVSDADVKIYDQNEIVMSIPGTTSAKGRITASFTTPGSFWIGIEKIGFADWESDEILIFAPRTTPTPSPIPSPTPSPTPVPTPIPDPSKYRADANMKLTDDEYRLWAENDEKRKADQNRNNQTTYLPPTQNAPTPWAAYGLIGLVVGGVALTTIKRKGAGKKDITFEEADDLPQILSERLTHVKENTEILRCEFCDWTTEAGPNLTEPMKKTIIELHNLDENPGTPKKTDWPNKGVAIE